MITGFNTDVRHGDVVFHVQTEDKGTGNPCIESLVYVGGQILARKRAGYRSLLDGDEGTKAVAELMERQHRSMIEEIRSGKMDDKVAGMKGLSKPAAEAPPAAAPAPAEPAEAPPPAAAQPEEEEKPAATAAAARSQPAPPPEAVPPPIDASTAIPQQMPPLPEAPKPPRRPPPPMPPLPPRPPRDEPSEATEPSGGDRSLDQVILDYLEMESGQDKLVLSMDRKSGEMTAGAEAVVRFRTESSVDSDPIGEALITVKLISTFEEPYILGEGRTDDSGELELKLVIPERQAGSGALIITAKSSIGDAEMRHLI